MSLLILITVLWLCKIIMKKNWVKSISELFVLVLQLYYKTKIISKTMLNSVVS